MTEPLVPSTLRRHESFRDDVRKLLRLSSDELAAVLRAMRDEAESQEVKEALRAALDVLRYLSSRAGTEGIGSDEAMAQLQELAQELELATEFSEKRELLATAFSAERLDEERAQRDLVLSVQYGGSRFQVVVITPWSGGGGAVAGLHWTIHLHGRDGDPQTVAVTLTQLQAEGLSRALTRGIEELKTVRETGSMPITNRLPDAKTSDRVT